MNNAKEIIAGVVLLAGLISGFVFTQGPSDLTAAGMSGPVNAVQPKPLILPTATVITWPTATAAPLATMASIDARPVIVFDEVVPVADSPERSSESMGACFSQYSRNRNQTENICLPEWFPADQAPRPTDKFWCASNGSNVEWVPARLFDGRSVTAVVPHTIPTVCQQDE